VEDFGTRNISSGQKISRSIKCMGYDLQIVNCHVVKTKGRRFLIIIKSRASSFELPSSVLCRVVVSWFVIVYVNLVLGNALFIQEDRMASA
jgi:hypothetical protein